MTAALVTDCDLIQEPSDSLSQETAGLQYLRPSVCLRQQEATRHLVLVRSYTSV